MRHSSLCDTTCLCDTAWLSASDPGLSTRAGVRFPDGDQGRMEDCVSVPLGFGDSVTAGLCALVEARLTPGCVAPITDREALCRYSVDLLHLTRPRAVCPIREAVDTFEHSWGATPGLSYADHRPGGSVPSQRIPPHPSSGCVPCTRGRQYARAHVVSRH